MLIENIDYFNLVEIAHDLINCKVPRFKLHFYYFINHFINQFTIYFYLIKYFIFQLFCYYHSSSVHSPMINFYNNFVYLYFKVIFIYFFSQCSECA